MDYIYVMHQAQKDRLEDAGVVQYRPVDGLQLRLPRLKNRPAPVRHLRAAALAIVSLIVR